MIRRLLIPLLGSGLLLAASAGSALAKCEADTPPEFCSEVIVDLSVAGGGGVFHAGTQESVLINISRGEQPFEASSVVLSFRNARDGTALREQAHLTVQRGVWEAEILLPAGGSWDVMAQVYTVDGAEYQIPLQTMQVARAPDLPSSTTPVTPPVTPTLPVLPIALLVAGIAGAALTGLAIRHRSRRRTAGAAAPSGAAASTATADRA